MLGVDFEGMSFSDAFLICDIAATLPGWEQERRFYFDPVWNPGRQVLIHPCPHGLYRIDWQVEPDFDLDAERSSGRLDHRIRQIIGDSPYSVDWSSVYHYARIASRFRAGRVFLAGDLAHLVAPFGARGLNSGVPDVENAAWKIAWTMRGCGAGAARDVRDGAAGCSGREPRGDDCDDGLPRAALARGQGTPGRGARGGAARRRGEGPRRLGPPLRALLVRRLAADHSRSRPQVAGAAPTRRAARTRARGDPA